MSKSMPRFCMRVELPNSGRAMLTLVALALAVERRREVETYDLRGPNDAVSRLTEQLENLGLTVHQYGTSMHLERDFTTHAAGASHKKTHSHARGHAHSAGPRLGAQRREVASELNKLEEDLRSMEQLEKGAYYDSLSAEEKALLPSDFSTYSDATVMAAITRHRANKEAAARPDWQGAAERYGWTIVNEDRPWEGAAERLGWTIVNEAKCDAGKKMISDEGPPSPCDRNSQVIDYDHTPFESDIGLQNAVRAGVERRRKAVRLETSEAAHEGAGVNIACDLLQILDASNKEKAALLKQSKTWLRSFLDVFRSVEKTWWVDPVIKFLKAGIGVMLFVFSLAGVIACPWLAFAIGVGVLVAFAAWDARQQYLQDKDLAKSVGSFFFNVAKGATLSALGVDVLKNVYDGFENVVAVVDMVCGARSDVKGKVEDWTKEVGEKLDESDDDWRFDGMTIPAGANINADMKEHLEQLVTEGKLKKVSSSVSDAAERQNVQAGKKGSDIKNEMKKDPAYKRAFDKAKEETLEWFECATFGAFGGSD